MIRNKRSWSPVLVAIFNEIMPKDFPYLNEPTQDNIVNGVPDEYFIDKGEDINDYLEDAPLIDPFKKGFLSDIIAQVFKVYKVQRTSDLLDDMKTLGYTQSTNSGLTVGIADITNLKESLKLWKLPIRRLPLFPSSSVVG